MIEASQVYVRRPRVRWLTYMFLAFGWVLFCLVGGCEPCIDGYKQFTMTEGFAHFSFEYPCDWRIGRVESRWDYGYTVVTVSAPSLKREVGSVGATTWHFRILSDAERRDAEALLEHDLSHQNTELDFKLLERSTGEFAGITAQEVVFSYRALQLGLGHGAGGPPEPTIDRDFYFDHNGFVWVISASSNMEVADRDNEHFDHLLEMFKILD